MGGDVKMMSALGGEGGGRQGKKVAFIWHLQKRVNPENVHGGAASHSQYFVGPFHEIISPAVRLTL